MSKVLKIIGVIVVLVVGSKLSLKLASNRLDTSVDAQVFKTVSAINAQLPKDLGSGVTFTKSEVVGKTFRSTYIIAPGAPFDPDNLAVLEANAVALACGSMAQMAKHGYTVDFHYEYTAAGGPKTLDISVPPSKCA